MRHLTARRPLAWDCRSRSRAHVTRVYRERKTPAAQAGIRPDDVIVAFDGVRVEDENHLINLVGIAEVGQAIPVEIVRGGRQLPFTVTLTDREEHRKAAEADGFLTR